MPRRVFALGIFLIVVAALYAVASTWIALERMTRVDTAGVATVRAEEARTNVQTLLASVLDIETATRGFSLSGDPTTLAPFEDGRVRAPQLLDRLRDQMRDNPPQLARVEQLTRFLAERIVLSEFIIERKRAQPEESAAVLPFGDRAAAATKGIREVLGEIDAEERERLTAANSAWSRELYAARTIEIASCVLALVVIAFGLWALVRWRRPSPADTSVTAEAGANDMPARTLAGATAELPDGGGIGALLEGLPTALQQLAARARKRGSGVIRESIDATLPSPPPAQAYLLYRAAEWAVDVVSGRARDGEIGVGLASGDGRITLRVEGPGKEDVELTGAEKREADSIATAIRAAGGTWQWTDGDGGRGATVLLAQIPQDPAAEATPSPCRGSGKAGSVPS